MKKLLLAVCLLMVNASAMALKSYARKLCTASKLTN